MNKQNIIETLERSTDELSHILKDNINEIPTSVKEHIDNAQQDLLELLINLKEQQV